MKKYFLLLILVPIFALLTFNGNLYAANCYNKCSREWGYKSDCMKKAKAKTVTNDYCDSGLITCKTACDKKNNCLDKCNGQLEDLDNACSDMLATQDNYNKDHMTADKYNPKTKEGCQGQYDKTPATLSTFPSIELTARNKMTDCMSNADTYMKNCKTEQKEKILNGSRNCNKKCSNNENPTQEKITPTREDDPQGFINGNGYSPKVPINKA